MEDETQEYDVVRFAFKEERLAALRRVSWRGGRLERGGDICIIMADLYCCRAEINVTM